MVTVPGPSPEFAAQVQERWSRLHARHAAMKRKPVPPAADGIRDRNRDPEPMEWLFHPTWADADEADHVSLGDPAEVP